MLSLSEKQAPVKRKMAPKGKRKIEESNDDAKKRQHARISTHL